MVTQFISLAATKSKTGPWGLAQQRIAHASKKSIANSKHTKKAIGKRTRRRRGPKDCNQRQSRKIHKVRKTESNNEAKGKHLYVNWGDDNAEAGKVFDSFNINPNLIIDVSKYRVIDTEGSDGHAVVIDDVNPIDPLFVCAKIDQRQSQSWLNGRTGINAVRNTLSLLKKSKPDQTRGAATSGINKGYKLFGQRKDPLSSENGSYTFKKGTNVESNQFLQKVYCELSYKMERAGRTLGNALYETGIYKYVQKYSRVPAFGRQPLTKKQSERKRAFIPDQGFGTALAVGEHYWSMCHIDRDFYLSVTSCISESTHDTGKVLHYFIFPEYEIMIPLKTGDILLFNPNVYHSCSNPSISNSIILSSYVSRQTVLVAETKNEKSKILVDSVVADVLKTMP